MNEKYRDMTADEKLMVIQAAFSHEAVKNLDEIINDLKEKCAIVGPLTVVPNKNDEKIVHVTNEGIGPIRDIINNKGLAGFANISPEDSSLGTPNGSDPVKGSIYASEHRPVAMAENGIVSNTNEQLNNEQPKARVLERENSTPNPWKDLKRYPPGQLNL